MRPDLILLAALLLVSAGILAAGCVSPGGNATQPTTLPTETATIPTGTETPPETVPTVTETLPATVTTATGGQSGY